MTSESDYKIIRVTTNDKPAIFEFQKKYFFTSEPFGEALSSLGRGNYEKLTLENLPMTAIDEDLSFMATTASGEIIGLIINAEVKCEKVSAKGKSPEPDPDSEQIMKLIEHINERIDVLGKTPNEGKEWEIRIICVHNEWKRKGVATKLLEATTNLAKELNFKQMRVTCTSAYSAKLCINYEFECVYAISYDDCLTEGRLNFRPLNPHTYIRGMILKI